MRQADYVAFTGRHPFTTEAYERGYAVGFRQNTSGFQAADWPNVDLPVLFLDNDFRDPDLDDYLELVDRYEPQVAVVGDATTRAEANQYQQAATHIETTYTDVEPIIVPKCRDTFDALEQDTVLGWPNGYADVNPLDYSTLDQWRGRDIHILGGSPDSQLEVIDTLTQPTLDQQPPANIVGLDGNGFYKAAMYGDCWTPDGYEPADHLSIRETVAQSLDEIKGFWQAHDVWPTEEPIDRYGPAVQEPDQLIWMDQGGDPIGTQDALEAAYVEDYGNGTMAFHSEAAKKHIAYHEGWS